jgi:hypothetical protein
MMLAIKTVHISCCEDLEQAPAYTKVLRPQTLLVFVARPLSTIARNTRFINLFISTWVDHSNLSYILPRFF